jgi:hypothetical protein
MGFIGASGFVQIAQSYRLIWVSGRFSGGKTSFAIRLAEEFLRLGYRLITNTPCVWADNWDDVQLDQDTGMLHAVVIMDEAGLALKATRQVEMMAAYAAKMDCIYLFPSFFPPIRAAQVVTVQPVFSFIQIGLPLIVYKWRVKIGAFEDHGSFLWLFPQEVWGVYSRRAPESSIYNLITYLAERVEDYRKRYGVADSLPKVEAEPSPYDSLRDSAETLAEAADRLSSLPARGNSRRRI